MPVEYKMLIAGAVLLFIELLIPGFGIFGILGLGFLTAGGYFLMGGGLNAFLLLAGMYLLLGAALFFFCLYLPRDSKWNPLILWEKQKNADGYTGSRDFSKLLNRTAITVTPLRPAGTILLDNERIDVSSFGDYIDKDVKVLIVKVEGSKIFVRKA